MNDKSNLEEQCHRILQEKGGKIADEARTVLLKEKSLEELRIPLQYASEHWRDPLTPSLVILSCEAVGGQPDEATYKALLALMLMNFSFYIWDDIIDETLHKRFTPTVLGKFGKGITLIIGGLASAKAFSILSEMKIDEIRRRAIQRLVWKYWRKLARAETLNLNLRKQDIFSPREKLRVFELEGMNLETSLKIGATLGDGSEHEIVHLGNYGRYLGTILELKKDFDVSMNLTFELSQKIKMGSLPYTLMWARDHSNKIGKYLSVPQDTVHPVTIKRIVEEILETGALEHIIDLVKMLTEKATSMLSKIRICKSRSTLMFLLQAQEKILMETFDSL